jgi:dTDP-glucose 4,6-dehydratase
VRAVTCYGPYEHYTPCRGFIPKFIYHALFNKPYTVFKGHKRIIDYVEYSCRTWANIVDNFNPGVVCNVGGRTECGMEIKEYSDIILQAFGWDDSLVTYEEGAPFTTNVKRMDFNKRLSETLSTIRRSP